MAETSHIDAPLVTVYSEANAQSEPRNVLLYGESLEVLDEAGDWLKIRSLHDGYEGYIPSSFLGQHSDKTHKVCAASTSLYDSPDFKRKDRHPLYFGSPVHATHERENGFARLANGGWVFEAHLMPIDKKRSDFVETAMLFLNAPYIWGGRSVAGIDCSGLVQVSLMAAGIKAPRDTAEQIEALGNPVPQSDLKRGDFVFFERHVGIMVDETHILNATSRHMRTLIEPLSDLVSAYKDILAIRRV
jgi:cell wall-associated NlpC family hydrolase